MITIYLLGVITGLIILAIVRSIIQALKLVRAAGQEVNLSNNERG